MTEKTPQIKNEELTEADIQKLADYVMILIKIDQRLKKQKTIASKSQILP